MALTSELDVRCYNADGTRKHLPQGWLDSVEFEVAERGGYRNGTLQLLVPWEQLDLTGSEYVDIRLWGQLLYRGYVRQPQREIAVPERASPTLYGLMERLNGYQVRRALYYGTPANVADVFIDLVNEYVRTSGRLPGLVYDTTGVAALSITLQQFDAKDKNISEALNALCDLAPNQLIWGCDVNGLGQNRLYLHPRATSVKYAYVVGGIVKSFVFPSDGTRVVNTLYVTGGKADGLAEPPNPPNLCPNASFEEGVIPGEKTGNLLLNPGFEDSSDPYLHWTKIGGTTADNVYTYNGGQSIDLDNNPSNPEGVWQAVSLLGTPTIYCSCMAYARPGNGTQNFYLLLEARDINDTVVRSAQSADFTPPGDAVWRRYTHSLALNPATDGATTHIRLTIQTHSGDSDNVNVDDCALWTNQPLAKSWLPGQNSTNCSWSLLEWQRLGTGPDAYDGEIAVRCAATLTGGGYAELTTDPNNHINVKQQRAYWLTAWVYATSTASVDIGVRTYKSSAVQTPDVMLGAFAVSPGAWTQVVFQFTTGADIDGVDILLRALTSGVVLFWDAIGLWEGALPPFYYPADVMQMKRDVTNYAGVLPANIAGSITKWDVREGKASNDNLLTLAQFDEFNQSYFKAYGDALVQATLTIEGASAPQFLDGQVVLKNLPSPPPPMNVAKVGYNVGENITLSIDLNDEVPELANLLRNTIAGQPS